MACSRNVTAPSTAAPLAATRLSMSPIMPSTPAA
jgi:hypothetical protein